MDKERRISQIMREASVSNQETAGCKLDLLDYLNCTFRTLSLARPANQAFVYLNGYRFSVLDLVDAYWASVDTCFASSALLVDNNFYHVLIPLVFLIQSKTER